MTLLAKSAELGGVAVAPSLPPEEVHARDKAARAQQRLDALRFEADACLQSLRDASHEAGDFIRALGLRGALQADTIDAAGNRRAVARAAWTDNGNWDRLNREQLFRAGSEAFDPPATLYFPRPKAKVLVAFVAGNGRDGLGDIDRARRALQAAEAQSDERCGAPPKQFMKATNHIEEVLSEPSADVTQLTAESVALGAGVSKATAARALKAVRSNDTRIVSKSDR